MADLDDISLITQVAVFHIQQAGCEISVAREAFPFGANQR